VTADGRPTIRTGGGVVPNVVAASRGIVTYTDLPLPLPRGVVSL
jgi:hypothetical protein